MGNQETKDRAGKVQRAMEWASKLILNGPDMMGYTDNEKTIIVLADEVRRLRRELAETVRR